MLRTDGSYRWRKGTVTGQWQTGIMNRKRMLVLSIAFHVMVAMTLLMLPTTFRHTLSLPTIYQVNLVTLPSPPKREVEPMIESQTAPSLPKTVEEKPPMPPPRVIKPKVVTKRLPEPKQAPRASASREAITSAPEKIQPSEPKTPMREGTSRPKEAIASVPTITAAVEIPDFKFGLYTRLIERKIGEAWSPPAIEIGHGSEEVVISFILMTTGRIHEIQVEKSSGNTFFDQAALRAAYMANPLPPFPRGFREPHLKVHFSFVLGRKG